MRKTIILITVLFINRIYSQDDLYNSISLNWGVGNIQRQDLSFSPMIHRDWSPVNFVLTFSRSKKFEQTASVKFGNYKPSVVPPYSYISPFSGNEYLTATHSFNVLDVNYAFGKKMIENDAWKISIGGRSRNRLNASNYNFGVFGSFGYYFAFGIDFWAKFEYKLSEKQRVISSIAIPIFSSVSRSPYMSQDDPYFMDNYTHKGFKAFTNYIKRGTLQSWGNSQSLDFNLMYTYSLSEKWDVGGSYWFSLNLNQQPTHFSSIENVICLSGHFKF